MEEVEDYEEEGIENILKERTKNNEVQYLVKWKGIEEPTWENEDDILDDYPLEIKKFILHERDKAKQKRENITHATVSHSSKAPTFPHQKNPRFTREGGKIVYIKRKHRATQGKGGIMCLLKELMKSQICTFTL